MENNIVTREKLAIEAMDSALKREAKHGDLDYILIAYSKKHNLNVITAYAEQKGIKYLLQIARDKLIR